MSELIDYDTAKKAFSELNTDYTASFAHGMLCGFACVKPNIKIESWLDEVLVNTNTSLNNLSKKDSFKQFSEIFNRTNEQLFDPTLNFSLLIADESCSLSEQALSLVDWCQGFLAGLGLSEVQSNDDDVMEIINDISEISKLDTELLENEKNMQNLSEIVEFIRMGVLLIQETIQPSKHDYVNLHL